MTPTPESAFRAHARACREFVSENVPPHEEEPQGTLTVEQALCWSKLVADLNTSEAHERRLISVREIHKFLQARVDTAIANAIAQQLLPIGFRAEVSECNDSAKFEVRGFVPCGVKYISGRWLVSGNDISDRIMSNVSNVSDFEVVMCCDECNEIAHVFFTCPCCAKPGKRNVIFDYTKHGFKCDDCATEFAFIDEQHYRMSGTKTFAQVRRM